MENGIVTSHTSCVVTMGTKCDRQSVTHFRQGHYKFAHYFTASFVTCLFTVTQTQMMTSSVRVLPFGLPMSYYMLDAKLFLQPQQIHHSKRIVSITKTVSLAKARISHKGKPRKNGFHGNQDVTHSLPPSLQGYYSR
jgi:hypothetical protein